jgi:GTP diphosphokinase / guanosine-3',5'-bis(diphosphate) 3'-diphosphatase
MPPILALDDLLDRVREYAADAELRSVRAAYDLSREVGSGSSLSTMEVGVQRPLAVARELADLRLDVDTLAVGLLYPAVDDGRLDVDRVREQLGDEIADLVEAVVKLSEVDYRSSAEHQAEAFRKMIFAMARDLRALLVKLADRKHTLQTLSDRPAKVQRRLARETLEIYAPIANRLGMQTLRIPFEDLSFKVLHPEIYARIDRQLAEREEADLRFIDRVVAELQRIADDNDAEVEVYGRVKHRHSIYRKMLAKRLDFEDVGDLVAFRVIVDDVASCYAVLGAIHGTWEPIHERFKDYISRSKPNGYQSLHTTVNTDAGERFEVQIRTREMHQVAELGIAAHWQYKEGHLALSSKQLERYSKVRQLTRMASEIQDDHEFVEMVKVDLFAGEVYVYTPTGEVRWFPRGATALDFAFSIHSEVGLTCIGAKANDRIVPLRYKLQSGDHMEVLTRKGQGPSRDWMRWVVTPRARTKIRAFLAIGAREQARQAGAELLERELRKRGKILPRLVKRGELEPVLTELKVQDVDELFKRLGYGSLNLERVAELVVPTIHEPDDDELEFAEDSIELEPVGKGPIRVDGLDGMLTTFARCCRPVPGDPILGYVTRGRGITIHRADCRQTQRFAEERLVEVEWSTTTANRGIRLRVTMEDRTGMLGEVTKLLGVIKINISSCDVRVGDDGYGVAVLGITVRSRDHMHNVMQNLERIKGVVEVARM